MSEKTHPGDTYFETLTFTDKDGDEFDPAAVAVVFLDPDGTVADTLAIGDLTKTATGIYELSWTVPSDAVAGTWIRKVTVTSAVGEVQTDVEPFNVYTMPYGTLSVVKRLTNLSDTTVQDSTLMGYLDDATDWANTALKRAGETTLPLSTVPPELNRIVSYYAAGRFLQRDVTEGKRHRYVEDAKEDLAEFVASTYQAEDTSSPFYIGTDTLE